MPLTRATIALMTPEQQLARRVRMRELGRKGGLANRRAHAAEPEYFAELGATGGTETARQRLAREAEGS